MPTVSELMSENNANAMMNYRLWGNLTYVVTAYDIFPDGTDVTNKLQALVNLANSQGRTAIFFPAGEYFVTYINNDENIYYFGDNAKFIGGYSRLINQIGQSLSASFINPKDYGAKGDGVTDDTAALNNAFNSIYGSGGGSIAFPYGNYVTSGPVGSGNNVYPLILRSEYGSILDVIEGSKNEPNDFNDNPLVWVQRFTKYDTSGDPFAHRVGGGFFEVYAEGSGNTTDVTENTWIGVAANVVQDSINRGDASNQKWDARGNVIGLMGSAVANGYPGNGNIITGVWGYSTSPQMDDATFNNLPAGESFSTVGMEINVNIRHKDPGVKDVLFGHGVSAGMLLNNYREIGEGIRDWTFGLSYGGSPSDGNYGGNDISLWSGYHTGIQLDKIKERGIFIGYYMSNNSYGIQIASNYTGMAQRPKAGITMGDSVLNMGEYYGAVFNNGDLWRNGNGLYFRKSTINSEVVCSAGVSSSGTFTGNTRIAVTIGGVQYYLIASTT